MEITQKLKKNKNIFYSLFLILISISVNQYYGYIGILPIDSFLIFNSGYDFLNGQYPFKDYWTIKEPFIDFLQAVFFKLFGVSWFTYVLHASVFNCLITVSTFFILTNFSLKPELSFFYSTCVAILTYPSAGTPFSDHHTLILCLISLYIFFLAIKSGNKFLWIFIPIILGLSFLSKQAPTVYITFIITVISLIYFIALKKKECFYFALLGFFIFIFSFLSILYCAEINFEDFLIQYILFPQSLGATRLDWIFPLEFQRIVLRFKIHYFSIGLIIYILIKDFIFKKYKINFSEKLIFTSLILTCFFFIIHQLMTINAIFIFCLIPIFFGFSHIISLNYLKNKLINYFLIFFTLASSVYYFYNYIHTRTFMDLKDIEMKNSVDGSKIDKRLSGIKWITVFYPNDPNKEIKNLKFAINHLNKDTEKKMLITDYQFISVFQNQYDFSVTRFWYDFHGYPSIDNKYFSYWKKFVFEKLKENEINLIYVLKPLHGEEKPLENLFNNCLRKDMISDTLYRIDIKNCNL